MCECMGGITSKGSTKRKYIKDKETAPLFGKYFGRGKIGAPTESTTEQRLHPSIESGHPLIESGPQVWVSLESQDPLSLKIPRVSSLVLSGGKASPQSHSLDNF